MRIADTVVLQVTMLCCVVTLSIVSIYTIEDSSKVIPFDYDVSVVYNNKTCYSKLRDPEIDRNKLKYTFCVYN